MADRPIRPSNSGVDLAAATRQQRQRLLSTAVASQTLLILRGQEPAGRRA
jgi:hypothetical protein